MFLNQPPLELLDADKIKMAIEHENQCCLASFNIFDSINSTNDYLLEYAKTGGSSGSVCFAEQQTKGRGRRGRVWYSPPGANIYLSLLWHFPASQPDLPALSMAVAVMLVHALEKYGINAGLELKWPNDVLFAGRKLAGILLERLPESNGMIAVVIGIGLNLQLPTEELPSDREKWIDVAEMTGQPVKRNYLAGLIVNELLAKLSVYQAEGLKGFQASWARYDAMQGKSIVVHTALASVLGVMQGINRNGQLLLLTPAGEIQQFQCGEVSVRVE